MAKYFACWRDTNDKVPKHLKLPETTACDLWLAAMTVFDQTDPDINDCVKVAKVLHGHLWIELNGDSISRLDLIRAIYTKKILEVYPPLLQILGGLFKF